MVINSATFRGVSSYLPDSDDYRRGPPPGPSYPPSAGAGGFYRGDEGRDVVRREAIRSRSRSRGREWGGGGSPVPPRYRSDPVGYRPDVRTERRPVYDEYLPRGNSRGDMRDDHRSDMRVDPRGDLRGDYPARRIPPPVAYRGDPGYDRGSASYDSRGGGGGYDRR